MNASAKNEPAKKATPIKDELNGEKRLSQLESLGRTLNIDNSERIMSYYDNSIPMIRRADIQYANDEIENAFISYMKFLDLFRNKIKRHVNYKRVPLSARCANQFYQRHAQLRITELRQRLLQHYKDLASTHINEGQTVKIKKLNKQDRAVSRMNMFAPKSISHTDAIDRATFDIEACRSLRTVVVPKQLPTIFQIITQRRQINFTIWGALAGALVDSEYVVTHLIMPKAGDVEPFDFGPDPCKDYAAKHRLIILGWIHIHRFSSCYLSSPDLHAQWNYQSRCPEAVAIVCAPRLTQVETYMLLEHGVEYVGRCTRRGMHKHQSKRPLYTIARHVKVVYHLQFELVYLDETENGSVRTEQCSFE